MLINKSIFSDNQGNALRLSIVNQASQPVYFQNFSAKYVVSGDEKYSLNNRKIVVKEGEYVLGNKNIDSSVLIDNSFPVKGICIDIAKELLVEIINYNYENSNPFKVFLFEQEWMVQKFNCNTTKLGYTLMQLSNEFENLNNGITQINKELFYTIAEGIVKDQSILFERFSNLKSLKPETNGRLFNFVYDAKNYMDNHFLEKISIEDMAREAKLSEYHFIRLFKTVFNTTPYKYIVKKRLEFAIVLLHNQYSISDISVELGYVDVPAFSNAFKLQFGISPKLYIAN